MNLKSIVIKILLIVIIQFDSCKSEKADFTNNSSLIIQTGFVCGWGAGTDSLRITGTTIRYVYYIPQNSPIPQILKTRSVTVKEWEEIQNCVQYDLFTKLNYNSCNVCFDGCDEWLQIQNENLTHKITFGKGMKIDTISKLQLKITALRAEFSQ